MRLIIIILSILFFSFQNASGQIEILQEIEKVEIGMSQDQVVELIGEPQEDHYLGEGPDGKIEIWHYKKDGKIRHSVEFTGGVSTKVVANFEQYQKDIQKEVEEARGD